MIIVLRFHDAVYFCHQRMYKTNHTRHELKNVNKHSADARFI